MGLCFERLIFQKRDTITTTLMLNNVTEVGPVNYPDLNMTLFWVLRKQDLKAEAMVKKTDLNEYIDYYFIQENADWYKPVNDGRFTSTRVEARLCTKEDFGTDDRNMGEKIFNDWAGFLLLCPDLKKPDDLQVFGDPSSMVSKAVVFNIDQCNPEKAKKRGITCKNQTEIDAYVKDIQADTWVAYFKMDFLDKDYQPTFKVNDIYDSQMLDNSRSSVVKRNYMYLRKNDLQLEDDYLQFEYTGVATYYDVGK